MKFYKMKPIPESMSAWGWGRQEEEGITKGNEETFGVICSLFDCSDGFVDVYMCQNLSDCTLRICAVYRMPIIPQYSGLFKKKKKRQQNKTKHQPFLSPGPTSWCEVLLPRLPRNTARWPHGHLHHCG